MSESYKLTEQPGAATCRDGCEARVEAACPNLKLKTVMRAALLALIITLDGSSFKQPSKVSCATTSTNRQDTIKPKQSRHLSDAYDASSSRSRWPLSLFDSSSDRHHSTHYGDHRGGAAMYSPRRHRHGATSGHDLYSGADALEYGDGEEGRHYPIGESSVLDPLGSSLVGRRFDYDYESHHGGGGGHKELEFHHKEAKEMSFVYPILLALLILGALFIPFIALFFFLAVSAFNCSGAGLGGLGGGGLGGAGFSQVTPVFGRRRRRRRSVPAVGDGDGGGGGEKDDARELASAFARALLGDFEQYLGGGYLAAEQERGKKRGRRRGAQAREDARWNMIATKLPLSMLFDSLEFIGATGAPPPAHAAARDRRTEERRLERGTRRRASASGAQHLAITPDDELRGRRRATNETRGLGHAEEQSGGNPKRLRLIQLDTNERRRRLRLRPRGNNEDYGETASDKRARGHAPREPIIRWAPIAGQLNETNSNLWDHYKTWQHKLATSTVLFRNALVKFIDH